MKELRNRFVRVGRFGGPEELELVDAPLPTAGQGEVRVRLASTVEYTEVLIQRPSIRKPFTAGPVRDGL